MKKTFFVAICLAFFILVFGCTSPDYYVNQNQVYYGGDWNKQDNTGFQTISFPANDVYVFVTKLNPGALYGFTASDGNLFAQYPGNYLVLASASAGQSMGSSEYGMKGFVNGVGFEKCYSHFHISAAAPTANPNFNCFVSLGAGDRFSIGFDDHVNPTNDLTLDSMNVTIFRIGD